MRGSFVYHKNKEYRKVCRKICSLTAVLFLTLCLLSSCGPEPGDKESSGQTEETELFSEQGPEKGKDKEEKTDSAAGSSASEGEDSSNRDPAAAGMSGAVSGALPPETSSA